jgi:hypothetical protein
MSGGENWLFNTSGPNHVGNAGNLSGSTFSGGHYAVIDASGYSGAGGSALLESPIIDVSSLTTAELTFYLISNEEGTGYSSTLTVEAMEVLVGILLVLTLAILLVGSKKLLIYLLTLPQFN